ncbi:MAG: 3-deoxy-manno-octulosonate cytidylyltransferase [Alphaproteobacteria bacterium]|nr:3-deoxy-manno-octulosonate cytidylyltransferase [Alphaproteobacteria bacterium]|tara:strand:- start:38 stop:736 length:699 start_codon:yes stop_codon:yes gene_type:complete
MASTRLPGKPLADIHGQSMIVHCLRRAEEAEVGPVVVACAEAEIAGSVEAAGGRAVMTEPDLPSGSDRIQAALMAFDPDGQYDAVVNLQGDLPTLDPAIVRATVDVLRDASVDISTAVCAITEEAERDNPNVVKAVLSCAEGARTGRALYFSRATVPTGPGDHFHHIGLYAYRRAALERFVTLPASPLEQREKLEQLRALEAGMRIDAACVDTVPLGVDTPADLERARALLA